MDFSYDWPRQTLDNPIDREGEAQRDFGKAILDYCDNMRTQCNKMLQDLNNARDNIKNESTTKSIDQVECYIRAILNSLPGLEEFGHEQKRIGENIIEIMTNGNGGGKHL